MFWDTLNEFASFEVSWYGVRGSFEVLFCQFWGLAKYKHLVFTAIGSSPIAVICPVIMNAMKKAKHSVVYEVWANYGRGNNSFLKEIPRSEYNRSKSSYLNNQLRLSIGFGVACQLPSNCGEIP